MVAKVFATSGPSAFMLYDFLIVFVPPIIMLFTKHTCTNKKSYSGWYYLLQFKERSKKCEANGAYFGTCYYTNMCCALVYFTTVDYSLAYTPFHVQNKSSYIYDSKHCVILRETENSSLHCIKIIFMNTFVLGTFYRKRLRDIAIRNTMKKLYT